MTRWQLIAVVALLGVGVVLGWLNRRRRRRQIEPPVTAKWLDEHDYHKDGYREK